MTVIASKSRYCINEDVLNQSQYTVEEICGHEKQLSAERRSREEEDEEGEDNGSFKRGGDVCG